MSRFPTLALVAALCACSEHNPYYCEANPDHNCTLDAAPTVDGPMTCHVSDDCSGARPVCDDVQGICVACKGDQLGSCSGLTPVCSSANECKACVANPECPSQACMPDGSCADPSLLLYASPTGGATTCMAGDKCSLQHAITTADATRKLIVLDPGTYNTAGTITIDKPLTLLARDAQIVKGGSATGPVLSITSGGNVTIYYAKISSGDDDAVGHGIACASATLVAKSVTIQNNDANGINATGCDVTLDRSTIVDNDGGGIYLQGTTHPFSVTNSFFYLNGDPSASFFGGARIAVATPSSSRFEFNTVVDNYAFNDPGNAGGVLCSTISAANNIIARNSVGASTVATNSQVFGSCTHASSVIQASVDGLAFVNAMTPPYDLRIGAASIAKDMATTVSPITIDYDGDLRPQHGGKDIGADELR